ncbi:MAG: hypothetical protein WCQ59_09710, partial [Candidatus Cloacimonadaceae bacterium]
NGTKNPPNRDKDKKQKKFGHSPEKGGGGVGFGCVIFFSLIGVQKNQLLAFRLICSRYYITMQAFLGSLNVSSDIMQYS